MADWVTVTCAAPELAAFAVRRLAGRVAYLATLRADGGPRVHPVTPIVGTEQLFLFMEPGSPKGRDLHADARYALHCGVEDNEGGGGEVAIRGRARQIHDPALRAEAVAAASYAPHERYILFALQVDELLTTTYDDSGKPIRQRWRDQG